MSVIEDPLIPSIKAFIAPALVPINKSKESNILLEVSCSNLLRKYTEKYQWSNNYNNS